MLLSTRGKSPTTWKNSTRKVPICQKNSAKGTSAPLVERLSITAGAWRCTWRRHTGCPRCLAPSVESFSRASWPWITIWRMSTMKVRGIIVLNQDVRWLCRTLLISRFQLKFTWLVVNVSNQRRLMFLLQDHIAVIHRGQSRWVWQTSDTNIFPEKSLNWHLEI